MTKRALPCRTKLGGLNTKSLVELGGFDLSGWDEEHYRIRQVLADIGVQALKATKFPSEKEWLLDLPCLGALPRLARRARQWKMMEQLRLKLELRDPRFSFTVDALETLLVFYHPLGEPGSVDFGSGQGERFHGQSGLTKPVL